MVSFGDAVDSALASEYEISFDGYELLELHMILVHSSSDHFRVVARELLDKFYQRVVRLNSLPFDDLEDGQ